MADALKSRREWERAGLVLSTGTAQDIRTAPDFGHREGCADAAARGDGERESVGPGWLRPYPRARPWCPERLANSRKEAI